MGPDRSQPYRYKPLWRSEFRLLVIHSMPYDIEMRTLNLSAPPIYECLSYVWESDENSSQIFIDNRYVSITQNLKEALYHVQARHFIWIDAVCIDQSNARERSQQVAKMDRIFESASGVTFWLGPERDNSTAGMRALNWLGSRIDLDENGRLYALHPLDEEHHGISDVKESAPFSVAGWWAIGDVVSGRPWFKRLWIRQEAFLAGPSSVVQCGFHRIPWPHFRDALRCINKKPRPQTYLDVYEEISTFGAQYDEPSFGLRNLRGPFESAICKDPRDRIYAVRQFLACDLPELEIIPDYNLSAMEVYQQTVENYLSTYQDLSILCECRFNPDGPIKPTWVPDWSDNSFQGQGQFWAPSASSLLCMRIEMPVKGVLRTAGVLTTTIETLLPMPFDKGLYTEDAAKISQGVRRIMLGPEPPPSAAIGDTELDIHTRSFTCNSLAENNPPALAVNLPTLQEGKESIVRALACRKAAGGAYLHTHTDNIIAQLGHGRLFFRAPNGDFGLVPAATRVGDHISVLVGCETPIVLRPNTGGTFMVIGECFMLRLMQGEALLGNLPPGVRITQLYSEKHKTYRKGFRHDDTGDATWEDPRFKQLGIDLMDYRRSLADDPGSELTVDFDTLRRANLAVRYLDLV